MSRLELHDCTEHEACTIIRSDGAADDTHIRGDVLPVLNQSYPHYDYRAGGDGETEVWASLVVPELSPLAANLAIIAEGLANWPVDGNPVNKAALEAFVMFIDTAEGTAP